MAKRRHHRKDVTSARDNTQPAEYDSRHARPCLALTVARNTPPSARVLRHRPSAEDRRRARAAPAGREPRPRSEGHRRARLGPGEHRAPRRRGRDRLLGNPVRPMPQGAPQAPGARRPPRRKGPRRRDLRGRRGRAHPSLHRQDSGEIPHHVGRRKRDWKALHRRRHALDVRARSPGGRAVRPPRVPRRC
jgi:hypothetical protein